MAIDFSTLNPQQKRAVEQTQGPVLILAGAGTGKTKVLTSRIAHIIQQGLASPHEILAVTFTNKAAREMNHRISLLLEEDGQEEVNLPWVGTFHSIALRILRRHYDIVGLRPSFTILDADDSLKIIKDILKSDEFTYCTLTEKFVANAISRLKDKALLPSDVKVISDEWYDDDVLPIYRKYQAKLCELNCVDFGDLIMLCIKALQGSEQILDYWQSKFKYIMVDEYQDTNVSQYIFARALANKHKNICCVGDDDQSIYSWRGAEVGNILQFNKEYEDALIVKLEQNYRSTNNILDAASSVIKNNSSFRFGKKLWSDKGQGDKILVATLNKSFEESDMIADKVKQLNLDGKDYNDMAVLVRAAFHTREIEKALNKNRIPYRMVGGTKFYARLEVKDALAYLRVVVQQDDDLAFLRIINTPKRGVGNTAIDKINKYAEENNLRAFGAVKTMLEEGLFKGKAKESVAELMDKFDDWIKYKEHASKADLLEKILNESGYYDMYEQEGTDEARDRIANLKSLLDDLQNNDKDLVTYLEDVSLETDADKEDFNESRVSLMTMHSAKGLEYDVVFLPCWEEGSFPSSRSLDEKGNKALEEERRLAYVAITRAKEKLFIFHCKERSVFGKSGYPEPSRFLDEIDEANIKRYKSKTQESYSFGKADNKNIFELNDFSDDFSDKENLFFDEDDKDFKPDNLVYHKKFGQGKVVSISGKIAKVRFVAGNIKEIDTGYLTKLN